MNVPKLRFKEFNDEWCETTLGETTTFKQGIQVDVDKQFSKPFDNSVRFIRIVDYTQNTKDIRYISKPANANYVDEHDVVLVRYGATAGFVGHGIKGVIANNMFTVTPNSNINKDFLYTILKQDKIYNKLNSSNGSSAMPALNFGSVSILKFSYPSINEQNKLTNLINSLDKKIELQSRKIEDLKLFKKGLNKNIFSNFNAKYKVDELIKEYNKKTSKNNQFEVLSSTANGIILQTEYFNKQAASPDNTGYKIVPFGFITYRSMSDTGEFHFNIQNIIENGIVSPAYPVFEINEDIVDKTYFVYYINENKSFKNKILSSKEGGTRYALSISKFKEINLDLPTLEYQKKCSKLLNTYNKKIKNEENKLNKLQGLKKGLMQNMFV